MGSAAMAPSTAGVQQCTHPRNDRPVHHGPGPHTSSYVNIWGHRSRQSCKSVWAAPAQTAGFFFFLLLVIVHFMSFGCNIHASHCANRPMKFSGRPFLQDLVANTPRAVPCPFEPTRILPKSATVSAEIRGRLCVKRYLRLLCLTERLLDREHQADRCPLSMSDLSGRHTSAGPT